MATLLVKFSDNLDISDSVLHPVDEGYSEIAEDLIIRNATAFHWGHDAVVYKGELSRGDHSTEEVVLKFIATSRQDACSALEREFSFYGKELKSIQGTVVPICYGLFRSQNNRNICLVLQYCGKPLEMAFNLVDMDLRLDILEQLIELHEHGVQHNDIAERNVVVNKDGKPFIIDFECADPHECDRSMSVHEGLPAPNKFDFECEEIYDFCYEYGVWRPGSFAFGGVTVSEDRATSVQELVNAALEHSASLNKTVLWEEAEKIFKLAMAIKNNDGYMPRPAELDALGIEGVL